MNLKIILILTLLIIPGVLAVTDSTEDVETEIQVTFNGTECLLQVWDETGDSWDYELDDCQYDEELNKTLKLEFERDFKCESDKICNVCEDLDKFQRDCEEIYKANTDISSQLVACQEREKTLTDFKTKSETCESDKNNINNKLTICENERDDLNEKQGNSKFLYLVCAIGGAVVYHITRVYKKVEKADTSEVQSDDPTRKTI